MLVKNCSACGRRIGEFEIGNECAPDLAASESLAPNRVTKLRIPPQRGGKFRKVEEPVNVGVHEETPPFTGSLLMYRGRKCVSDVRRKRGIGQSTKRLCSMDAH